MILAYPLRLLGLCLASFFLVHLALGLGVSLLSPSAVRMAEHLRARVAARLLLGLRLMPAAGAVFLVAGLCVPSYLWLEPEAAAERVSWTFLAAALFAISIWGISIARGLRAAVRSLRYHRACLHAGVEERLKGQPAPVWIVESPAGGLALAGILRPRVFVSRSLVEALPSEQLAAALRHERAHQASRDNLKRLFLLLAPGLLPFHRGFEALERGWAKFAEWAADDSAAAGDPFGSVTLAAALVRVARMGPNPPASFLVTSLLGGSPDLPARVDRLLRAPTPARDWHQVEAMLVAAGSAILAMSLVAMSQPETLSSVHGLLEHLVR